MDELLKFYSNPDVSLPSNIDFLFGFFVTLLCSLILCYSYKKTHSGYSFSDSFLISLVLISLIVCLIMIIIGSNIARAFALIGAMSIVRFRNPVKETRDLVYIFAAIALGMSAGTGFYSTTFIFALLFCIVTILFNSLTFFKQNDLFNIISVNLTNDQLEEFEKILNQNCRNFKLVSQTKFDQNEKSTEFVFELELIDNNSLSQIYIDCDTRGYSNIRSVYGSSIVNA